MSSIYKSYLALVQKAALTGIWSKGVKLSRDKAVGLEEASEEELVFRVRIPGRAVAPLCVLYLKEGEWTCDCGSERDPCEHVVASAVTAANAAAAGEAVKTSVEITAQLAYRLKRTAGPSLIIKRLVVETNGKEELLSEPLHRLIGAGKCPVQPNHADMAVDSLLTKAGTGSTRAAVARGLSPDGMLLVLRAISMSRGPTLDDEPIEVDLDFVMPRARVVDAPDGVELRVERSRGLEEILDRGVGISKGKLRPLGALELTGMRLERLPLIKVVKPSELGPLVSEILPSIERHVAVEIETDRLPGQGGKARPHINFDLSPHGHTLSVLPTLVYGHPPNVRIDGEDLVHISGDIPRRNRSAEKLAVLELRERLDLVCGRLVHFDGSDAAKFAKKLQEFQKTTETAFSRDVVSKEKLKAEIIVEGSRFSINFKTEEGEPREASVHAVYQAWRDGLDVVPLVDGGWAPLPADWLARYGHQVADILAARRDDGVVPAYAAAPLAALCQDIGQPPPPSFAALVPLLEEFNGLPDAKLPAAVTATLRPYQQIGLNWLTFLRDAGLGAVLADDMGLGKTLQTLCAVKGKVLVVCPRSVVFNWEKEVKRFRPDLPVNIYHGPKRTLDDRASSVTITTYAVLRLDADALVEHGFDTVVLDEAQAIKNADSQAARAAFQLSESLPETAFRVALTGTPVENRLDELWSILRYTHPGLLGPRAEFRERYSRPISEGNDEAALRLRQLIKPFLLRRLKKDVLKDLPPRTDVILTVELSDEERQLYDSLYAAKQKEVVEELRHGGSVMAALEALLRLRQAACHPALVPGQEAQTSSKVEALLEAVSEAVADDHKCIVFSQWTSLLDLVEKEFEREDISWVRLDGTTRDRGAVVDAFQADDGPPVILSSLKAGGTGLNLTAADHVFLLDPWWNPAAEDQAADRAHRIGQMRPVTVYRLIAKDTVEEGIMGLQERKRAVANAALSEGGAAAGVTRADLLELLGGDSR